MSNNIESNNGSCINSELLKLDDTDPRKIIAIKFVNEVLGLFGGNDGINDVEIVKKDDRVAFVETWGHGYLVLAKDFKVSIPNFPNDDKKAKDSYITYPIGYVIGEEDGGLDKEWKKLLGWNSTYDRDMVDDDDDEDEEESE
jgi:hypothetical protein